MVVALQWTILNFENSFVTLAIAEENSRKELVVETLSPFSGMRRISSKDKLKILSPSSSNSHSSDSTDGCSFDKMKRVSSVTSISSLGKLLVFVIVGCAKISILKSYYVIFYFACQEIIGNL